MTLGPTKLIGAFVAKKLRSRFVNESVAFNAQGGPFPIVFSAATKWSETHQNMTLGPTKLIWRVRYEKTS